MFLTARWEQVALLSYAVEPALLAARVPTGTELDLFEGRAYLTLVGFRFLDTRVLGIGLPFHRDFDEINLRFYVRRRAAEGWRRGVVFVREIVPRALIAWVARRVYGEPYVAWPMRHDLGVDSGGAGGRSVGYGCHTAGRWHDFALDVAGLPALAAPGSLDDFITDHLWGYTRRAAYATQEYEVEHPRWRLVQASASRVDLDARALYGGDFVACFLGSPVSALVAEGSAVSVRRGVALAAEGPA